MPSSTGVSSLLPYSFLLEFVMWKGVKVHELSVHWVWAGLLGKGRDLNMGIVESQHIQSIGL